MDASVWLIGEARTAEFSQAVAWLGARAACRQFADARDAVAQAASRRAGAGRSTIDPDAIVFCAARPGSIWRTQVDALSRAFPLARLAALVGPWCEGELRSGRPWPGVSRVYWHQWQSRLPELLNELGGSVPRLPRTATDVDVLLSSHGQSRPAKIAGSVGIVAARHTDFEALAGVLGSVTGNCRWLLSGAAATIEPVDVLLVDAAGELAAAMCDLEQLRSAVGPVPALVLCHFPRPEEACHLLATPRTEFLAQPFLVRDLLHSLAALMGAPAQQIASSATAAA